MKIKSTINEILKEILSKESLHFINQKQSTKFINGVLYNNSKISNYNKIPIISNFNQDLSISLMTWNILATGYTSPTVYYYVSPEYLDENHRMNIISHDLFKNNCDIICLQEVEKRNFEKFMKISENFYNGIYEKRTGLTCDGLSLLYKKDKFRQIHYEQIKLNNLSTNTNKIIMSSNLNLSNLKKMPMTHNIAQLIILEPENKCLKDKIDYFLIVNLHLHWDPNKDIIKMIQIYEILNRIKEIYKEFIKDNKNVSILICGDFNSLPDSNVVSILKNKNIVNDKYKELLNLFENIKNDLYGNDNILNLFESFENNNFVTNIKPDFKGKLDHIFYQNKDFFRKSEISFYDTEKFINENALPNSLHASDHIYLISKFYL